MDDVLFDVSQDFWPNVDLIRRMIDHYEYLPSRNEIVDANDSALLNQSRQFAIDLLNERELEGRFDKLIGLIGSKGATIHNETPVFPSILSDDTVTNWVDVVLAASVWDSLTSESQTVLTQSEKTFTPGYSAG